MNIREMFPSKYLAASDLGGRDVQVFIERAQMEEVGQKKELCGVVYFRGVPKGMVTNKTNGKRIAKMYGEETDLWVGKPITLYPSETDYQGETVPCIRVRDKSNEMQAEKLRALEAATNGNGTTQPTAPATGGSVFANAG